MKTVKIGKLNFQKMGGLIPVIIQDAQTQEVLMLGFMNREAAELTLRNQQVMFWSRTRKKLWRNVGTPERRLDVVSIDVDCDNDTLLIKVKSGGPTCHTGAYSCFDDAKRNLSISRLT